MLQKMDDILQWLSEAAAQKLVPAVLILVAGLLVIRIVMTVVKKLLEKTHLEKAAHGLVKSVARVVLYVLLGLILAGSLGIDVTSIVALASVLTLAVSLSLQNALANVFGGFTLLYTHPFKSGDFVEVAGKSGTVQEISMTYTKLATPDNKIISIPNSSVVAGDIINYTVSGTRRVEKALLDPAPMAVIDSYTDNAIAYSLRVWTKTEDFWDVYFLINRNVREVFEAQGIKMAYPHMHIYMEQ